MRPGDGQASIEWTARNRTSGTPLKLGFGHSFPAPAERGSRRGGLR